MTGGGADSERMKCLVPFCQHTRGPRKGDPQGKFLAEWICGAHWNGTDRRLRASYYMARKRRLWRTEAWYWEQLKAQAIERAMGVTA